MEKEQATGSEPQQLIGQLEQAQGRLEPGDGKILDFEIVIQHLRAYEHLGYGHAPLRRQQSQQKAITDAKKLLGLSEEDK